MRKSNKSNYRNTTYKDRKLVYINFKNKEDKRLPDIDSDSKKEYNQNKLNKRKINFLFLSY